MDIKSGVYMIKNLINGRVYIGSSINIIHREYVHFSMLKRNTHHNEYLQNAYNKYGKNNFSLSIIEEVEVRQLSEREEYWIKYHNALDRAFGYNISIHTDGVRRLSEETKIKARNTVKNKYKNGYINPFKGKKHADATKKIIGIKSSQKVFKQENKDNLLEKSNLACYKKVYQYSQDGEFIKEHTSINEATKSLFQNMTHEEIRRERKGASIGLACNEKRNTAFGYIWSFDNPLKTNYKIKTRKIIQYDLSDNKINIFPSCKEASCQLNIKYNSIYRGLKNGHSVGEYKFKYAT